MKRLSAIAMLGIGCAFSLPNCAAAQESTEDRMRDALRQSVMEMLADKAALQKELDDTKAQLASAPKAKPVDIEAMRAQLRAAVQAGTSLQQQNAQLQTNLQNAAAAVQAKDEQTRKAVAAAKSEGATLEVCKATNAKLIDVSQQVLHLYESQSFRSILLKSYEPIIGTAKVRLENLVQQYDDKIRDQAYFGPK
jgi:regulator of replication initiation timing